MGNDLSTPRPWFPGLKPGKIFKTCNHFFKASSLCNAHCTTSDFTACITFFSGDRWALCAVRWFQAQRAGKAPLVKLNATNKKALTIVPQRLLEQYDDRRFMP